MVRNGFRPSNKHERAIPGLEWLVYFPFARAVRLVDRFFGI